MNKTLPDKWVRKALHDLLNDMVVDGHTIKCYDSRVTGSSKPKFYILLTTQENSEKDYNKCEKQWLSSILIDIVTIYPGRGNTGSRLLADNILDRVRSLTDDFNLDAASGLRIHDIKQRFPNDISTSTPNQNIFRKFLRLELEIN